MVSQYTFDEVKRTVGLDKIRSILKDVLGSNPEDQTEEKLRAMWNEFRKVKPYACPYDELAIGPTKKNGG